MIKDYGRDLRNKEAVPSDLAEEFREKSYMSTPNPEYQEYTPTRPEKVKVFPSERIWNLIHELIAVIKNSRESEMISEESINVLEDCFLKISDLPEVKSTRNI